jgi:hypothetical protein
MIWGYFNNRKEKIDYAKKIKFIIVRCHAIASAGDAGDGSGND